MMNTKPISSSSATPAAAASSSSPPPNSAIATIDNLPEDCLLVIFDLLPVSCVIDRVGCVCTRWFKLVRPALRRRSQVCILVDDAVDDDDEDDYDRRNSTPVRKRSKMPPFSIPLPGQLFRIEPYRETIRRIVRSSSQAGSPIIRLPLIFADHQADDNYNNNLWNGRCHERNDDRSSSSPSLPPLPLLTERANLKYHHKRRQLYRWFVGRFPAIRSLSVVNALMCSKDIRELRRTLNQLSGCKIASLQTFRVWARFHADVSDRDISRLIHEIDQQTTLRRLTLDIDRIGCKPLGAIVRQLSEFHLAAGPCTLQLFPPPRNAIHFGVGGLLHHHHHHHHDGANQNYYFRTYADAADSVAELAQMPRCALHRITHIHSLICCTLVCPLVSRLHSLISLSIRIVPPILSRFDDYLATTLPQLTHLRNLEIDATFAALTQHIDRWQQPRCDQDEPHQDKWPNDVDADADDVDDDDDDYYYDNNDYNDCDDCANHCARSRQPPSIKILTLCLGESDNHRCLEWLLDHQLLKLRLEMIEIDSIEEMRFAFTDDRLCSICNRLLVTGAEQLKRCHRRAVSMAVKKFSRNSNIGNSRVRRVISIAPERYEMHQWPIKSIVDVEDDEQDE